MTARVRGRLLCEDRRQESFFRALLEPIFDSRLDVKIAPRGAGAASAWVIRQYPASVREWIRRRPGQNVALCVAIDGDNHGPAARRAQADQELEAVGEAARGPAEPIAVCVPTWSIETWLLFLQGDAGIVESGSYKHRFERLHAFDLQVLADKLRQMNAAELPSLRDGIQELERVRR